MSVTLHLSRSTAAGGGPGLEWGAPARLGPTGEPALAANANSARRGGVRGGSRGRADDIYPLRLPLLNMFFFTILGQSFVPTPNQRPKSGTGRDDRRVDDIILPTQESKLVSGVPKYSHLLEAVGLSAILGEDSEKRPPGK